MSPTDKVAMEFDESFVTFTNNQGTQLRASPVRITRYGIVFELYNPGVVVQNSEVLTEFQILLSGRTAYSGRAIVRSLVHTGGMLVCEVSLDDGWIDVDLSRGDLEPQLRDFVQSWHKLFIIDDRYKLIVADMQSFLLEMRLWADQVELGIRSAPSGDRLKAEQQAISELARPIIPAIDTLFQRFERIAEAIGQEYLPVHRAYMKRQLHPLVLCAPFAYRSYAKPLGYAGDYEMVNMMLRDEFEGGSVFAKLVNLWFLSQPPAQAHRNRIEHLVKLMLTEAAARHAAKTPLRVLNLGCGPAVEVQRFLERHDVSSTAEFTLIDFNDETLRHAGERLNEAKRLHGRRTVVNLVKKSVHQFLKEGSRAAARAPASQYDLIYSAGLFDYLSDQVCERTLEVLYNWLAPGGLILATNVHPSNPLRHGMDHLLDWNLIHRDAAQAKRLKPACIANDDYLVESDLTGVNIFMSARKPHGGN
jgi:extracellular factor (EF) 3-hydroxypalmitic acid methyl ester biosynthesis protein